MQTAADPALVLSSLHHCQDSSSSSQKVMTMSTAHYTECFPATRHLPRSTASAGPTIISTPGKKQRLRAGVACLCPLGCQAVRPRTETGQSCSRIDARTARLHTVLETARSPRTSTHTLSTLSALEEQKWHPQSTYCVHSTTHRHSPSSQETGEGQLSACNMPRLPGTETGAGTVQPRVLLSCCQHQAHSPVRVGQLGQLWTCSMARGC